MGLDRLLDSLKKSEKSGKSSSIIVVSEGEKIGDNVFSFSSHIEKNTSTLWDKSFNPGSYSKRGGLLLVLIES